jgi:hypothetical protein
MNEGYRTYRVQVGAERVNFAGRRLSHIPADPTQQKGVDFTLYDTPDEGRKLYVQEWVKDQGTDVRTPGERAGHYDWIGGALLTEEEAKEKHSQIFDKLLEQAQD